jgi:hypothetical protein
MNDASSPFSGNPRPVRQPDGAAVPSRKKAHIAMATNPSRSELIALYKGMLRNIIDRNPSGLRLRIASALGTHKSFLSQLTNPADSTPIPAKHLRVLFEYCHFTAEERSMFMTAYNSAHPRRRQAVDVEPQGERQTETLEVEIPVLDSPARQRALRAYVHELVRRLSDVL